MTDKPLKAYICSHPGVYLGGYTLVFASDETKARGKARAVLAKNNLRADDLEMREVPIEPGATLIWNGDY